MNRKIIVNSIIVTFLLITLVSCKTQEIKKTSLSQSEKNTCVKSLNFENAGIGEIPAGWKIENTKQGGVGLWTKADAVTSFNNFKATPYTKVKL